MSDAPAILLLVILAGFVFLVAPFLALASPDGRLTFLDGLPDQGAINTIATNRLRDIIAALR